MHPILERVQLDIDTKGLKQIQANGLKMRKMLFKRLEQEGDSKELAKDLRDNEIYMAGALNSRELENTNGTSRRFSQVAAGLTPSGSPKVSKQMENRLKSKASTPISRHTVKADF